MSEAIRLSIRRGDQEVASASPDEVPQKIGRSKQCDVVLEDPAVSRVHAVLSLEGSDTVLTDQGSQNGLWVQGSRVSRVVLDPGVVVALGPFRIVCEAASPSFDDTIRPESGMRADARAITPPPRASGARPVVPPMPTPSGATGKTTAVPSVLPIAQPADPRVDIDSKTRSGPVPSVKSTAAAGLPSSQKQTAPHAITPKRRGNPIQAMLLVAALVMVIVGAGGTALLLKWRNASAPSQAREAVSSEPQSPTTSSAMLPVSSSVTTSASSSAAETAANAAPSTSSAAADTITSSAGTPSTTSALTATTSSTTPSTSSVRDSVSELPAGVVPAGRRPRETRTAWIRRSTELTRRLNEAKAAIEKGDFAAAVDILIALQRDEPNFGDTGTQLARAREGLRSNAQARAQAAFDDGQQKERQQDFVGAIQSYQQAERIDPEFASRATQAISAARAKQKALVDDLFKQANAEFAFRRPSAIPIYQRLLKLLSEDDPRRSEAQSKLNQLLGVKQ